MKDEQTREGQMRGQRPHWTAYASVLLTAVLVLIAIVPYILGAVVPWFEAAVSILAVGAIVEMLVAFGIIRYRRRTPPEIESAQTKPPAPLVPAELLKRWKSMRDRLWLAFTARDRPGSMLMAEGLIVGFMNGERNAGRLNRDEMDSLNHAITAMGSYGYLVAHTALGWAQWSLEHSAEFDASSFGGAMETIQTVATEGRNAADGWVDLIRAAGAAKLGTTCRDEWGRFREPANLILNDLNSLVGDTYRETKIGIPYRFDLIRDI